MEIWKSIPNYENLYQVSNFGNVISIQYSKIRYLKQETVKGYKRVTLSKNNVQKRFVVHRLVALLFCKNNNQKNIVNHLDGNKKNNHFENLEWCTSSENEIHSYKVLLKKNPIRKLTEKQVYEIRNEKNIDKKNLAIKYKVSVSTIINVLKNKYYAAV